MKISVFDLFSIGIGPSSSHTVGPMRAALAFLNEHTEKQFASISAILISLHGSLAFTGIGHRTSQAILMGLLGELPETIDPLKIDEVFNTIVETKKINLLNKKPINFDYRTQLQFDYQINLPHHPNGMRFISYDKNDHIILNSVYYSVGGGFIVSEEQLKNPISLSQHELPFAFNSAVDLLNCCEKKSCTIAELMLENEKSWRDETSIKNQLLNIAHIMEASINQGCNTKHTILPGGLKVRRRAPGLYEKLKNNSQAKNDALLMEWLDLYAIAVNEENAAGNRVVTAPTNGAAGIIPAVLNYFKYFCGGKNNDNKIMDFLLTAGAIGILYKKNASISGAEMGCQGEVGVACSMAAAALCAVLGGNIYQVENAAEIGMEHNLGLTCDPVKGLVQIPCIERNAMGAIKAVNAAKLALAGDGKHAVSLDMVINTMREIGQNMSVIYKETSLGGLAVNVTEC